jgi:hypothetical protein
MTGALHFPLDGNVVLDSRRPEDVDKDDYDVLVASSGCLQGGPSKVFFERADLYEMPTILTGYLFPGTPARNLVGQLPRVRFSAHASHAHWQEYLGRFPNAACFLIHFPGDRNVTLPENVTIPELGRAYRVPPTAK